MGDYYVVIDFMSHVVTFLNTHVNGIKVIKVVHLVINMLVYVKYNMNKYVLSSSLSKTYSVKMLRRLLMES